MKPITSTRNQDFCMNLLILGQVRVVEEQQFYLISHVLVVD